MPQEAFGAIPVQLAEGWSLMHMVREYCGRGGYSGKDVSPVDRGVTYMAKHIAKSYGGK